MVEAREESRMSRAERLGPNWARRFCFSGLPALIISGPLGSLLYFWCLGVCSTTHS